MSLATVVVAVAAVVVWVGEHRGVAGPWRWSAKMLAEAVPEFYADDGRRWMAVASIALAVAAALVSGWAAVRAAAGLAVMREVTPNAGLRLAVVGLVGALGAMVAATPRVAVVDGALIAGRARIPVHLLGRAAALDRAGVREAMGPGLDARAYVCLRAWVGRAVRVDVVDEQDPTPYWVVSTRHPQQLLAAIEQARAARS